ncbi:MAG: hypothetical protein AB7U63_18550 [Porticoccaceae bacterium]
MKQEPILVLRPSRVWLALNFAAFAVIAAFFIYSIYGLKTPLISGNRSLVESLFLLLVPLFFVCFFVVYPLLKYFRLRVTMDGTHIHCRPVFGAPQSFSTSDIVSAKEAHLQSGRAYKRRFSKLVITLAGGATVDVDMRLKGYRNFVARLVEYQVDYQPYQGPLA